MKPLSPAWSRALALLCVGLALNGNTQTPEYRFSHNYSTAELIGNATLARQFSLDFVRSIGRTFHQPGIGYDAKTGLTFDGHPIDFETGNPLGVVRVTTAGSKEAPHICLLALALQQEPGANQIARNFISPDDPSRAPTLAKELLIKKLLIFEDFAARYPGYGGWLPWVNHKVRFANGRWSYGLEAADDPSHTSGSWSNRLPALDNGQFAWALLQAEGTLRSTGETSLADRVKEYLNGLKASATALFLEVLPASAGDFSLKESGEFLGV